MDHHTIVSQCGVTVLKVKIAIIFVCTIYSCLSYH